MQLHIFSWVAAAAAAAAAGGGGNTLVWGRIYLGSKEIDIGRTKNQLNNL